MADLLDLWSLRTTWEHLKHLFYIYIHSVRASDATHITLSTNHKSISHVLLHPAPILFLSALAAYPAMPWSPLSAYALTHMGTSSFLPKSGYIQNPACCPVAACCLNSQPNVLDAQYRVDNQRSSGCCWCWPSSPADKSTWVHWVHGYMDRRINGCMGT